MFNILYPDIYVKKVEDIPFDKLINNKIEGLIFDLDNTLADYDTLEATENMKNLFNDLETKGFKICILSNNSEERVGLYARSLNIPYVANGKKPGSRGILKAMKILNTKKDNTAMIGDQIFTDVLCGNINKTYTILVKPISKNEELVIKIKRVLEKIVLNLYKKNSK